MKNIKLARVDDRLIHGQVMTAWVQYTGARHIVIIDDQTAADEFTSTIISMAVPKNIGLDILSVSDAAEFLKSGEVDKPMILLAKYPDAFLQVIERGVPLEEVVVGGMGANKDRTKLYKNIAATDEERDIFKSMIDKGVHVRIQVIPDEKSVDIKTVL